MPDTDNVEFSTVAALTVRPPVTPSPPAVIFTLEANVATPECNVVEPNTAAPETPRPVPKFALPDTPKPPVTTNDRRS